MRTNTWLGPLFASVAAGVLLGCLAPRPFDEGAWQRKVESTRTEDLYAAHRDESGRYFNPWLRNDRSGWAFWRWVFSENAMEALAGETPPVEVVANDGAYLADPSQPASLTHVGHATFVLQWGGPVVVTDPFFSDRAAIVERRLPPAFGPERIPTGAVVLISHNHYDHLDSWSVEALAPRARFLCPPGLEEYLRDLGAVDVRALDWWEEVEVEGTTFTSIPVQHWSRRFGQGRNETLWCSWLVERDGERVYYGADSGYFKGFRELGRRYPGIRVALLGIGAYEPRWFMHYAHMNPPEVLRAFDDLGADLLVPTQWGVLELGDEPAAWPAVALREAMAARPELRARVVIPPVGGRLFLGR